MPIENEVGRRWAGKQRGDFPGQIPNLAFQSCRLHLQRGMLISVDYLAKGDVSAEYLR